VIVLIASLHYFKFNSVKPARGLVFKSVRLVVGRLKLVGWYLTPSNGWGRGEIPRRPNIRATPQNLNQRSKMEEAALNIVCRRGSDAGKSKRK